jgi:hypothetical protein
MEINAKNKKQYNYNEIINLVKNEFDSLKTEFLQYGE